jgi:hypothetical protein
MVWGYLRTWLGGRGLMSGWDLNGIKRPELVYALQEMFSCLRTRTSMTVCLRG